MRPSWAGELMMATNPKLPDYPSIPRRQPEHGHGKVQMIRQSKSPWPILAIIAGAVLLIAMIALLPRVPHLANVPSGAEIPQQPTAEQVQFTNAKIASAPTGDAAYLTAVLRNNADSAITGVQVEAQFLGRNGPILATIRKPVEGLANGTTWQDLTQAPIKPNESRTVRVVFEHTPRGWNHQLPELTVTTVTGTTP
jgi:Protein of unknown function (DUF3426)